MCVCPTRGHGGEQLGHPGFYVFRMRVRFIHVCFKRVCVCISFMCVCPTRGHGGEQLGHPVGVALGAGGEDPQQTLQTHLGQTAALLPLPPRLHRARDVSVAPHQHPTHTHT